MSEQADHYTLMKQRLVANAESNEEIERRRTREPIDPHTDPYSVPLESIDPAEPILFQYDKHWAWFERLRKEDPVHWTEDGRFGSYWSVTKFNDIMYVDTHHDVFSSSWEYGGITIGGMPESSREIPMFIAMDPPEHDIQRKAVAPEFTPRNLATLEPLIRERASAILDALPVGEEFNWVERVSIELTAQMLATLFDVPQEDRMKLIHWSNTIGGADDPEQQMEPEEFWGTLAECGQYFAGLWNQRVNEPPKMDLVSLLAHNPNTRNMTPGELLGNAILLIVGGNDTTRNSISGGVLALNQNPREYEKLIQNPDLIPSMVPEIIRWQTPLAHMRRTAVQDVELGGKQIRAGDKVVMWYVSGNRDDEVIEQPNDFIIDRERPRHHLSFGFGLHRCLGNRVGEMQLNIIWEEILKRFSRVEVTGEPVRVRSAFVKGYKELPVTLHA